MNDMTHDEIRTELNTWLDEHWNPELSLREWRETLLQGGWASPGWPVDYFGRGFDQAQTAVVNRTFAERAIVPAAQTGPRRLWVGSSGCVTPGFWGRLRGGSGTRRR